MKNKQTAVEWLIDKIQDQRENGNNDLRTTLYYCEQAKEMEKQQVIDAWDNGYIDCQMLVHDNGEQYYDETYGK